MDSPTRKIRVVQKEGNRNVSRDIDFYNLDAIIAMGYRVNSFQATSPVYGLQNAEKIDYQRVCTG